MTKLAMTLFLGVTLGACGSDGGAAGSGGGGGTGGGGTGGGSAAPTFTRVKTEIIAPSCALSSSCHKGTGKASMALDVDPYKVLMGDMPAAGKASCEFPGMKLVVPGMPDQSLVYLKVTTPPPGTPDPMCPGTSGKNERMPMSSDMLEAPRVQLLKDWILAGAKND